MENTIGIINNSNLESEFPTLCRHRPVYMLPFGGRYRLVDFILSNMVNNGIKTIAIYTGEKIRSTMDHLGNGKPWNLNSRFQGLFLYPPIHQDSAIERLGDIADFYSTLSFLERRREDYVMITTSNVLSMQNLDDAYKKFVDCDADILMMYVKKEDNEGKYINMNKLHIDEEGYVTDVGINLGTERKFNTFTDTFLIKRDVLIKIVKTAVENGNANSLFDAILRNRDRLSIVSYELDGYVEILRDLESYFKANLELLNRQNFKTLFSDNGRVMTKTKDEPSTIYRSSPEVENCLVANGCEIEGDVENSIIFRGVKIGKGAIVRNSIIMQKCEIEEGAVIVNSILDKFVKVEKDVSLVGSMTQPYVVGKSETVKKD